MLNHSERVVVDKTDLAHQQISPHVITAADPSRTNLQTALTKINNAR